VLDHFFILTKKRNLIGRLLIIWQWLTFLGHPVYIFLFAPSLVKRKSLQMHCSHLITRRRYCDAFSNNW